MISPNLILHGSVLRLRMIDGRVVSYGPANQDEFYNFWIRDAVMTVEYIHYTGPCPDHKDRSECVVNCSPSIKTVWTRFYPLAHVLEMTKEAV